MKIKLLLAFILMLASPANAQLTATGVGGGFGPAAGGTYTGPGDIIAFSSYWGLRAYSNATIGNNVIRLRESGGNTEQDFVSIAGGGLDLAAIATFKGANNLFVVTWYDQVGSNNVTQSTTGLQPAFTLSGLGSLPIVAFTRSSNTRLVRANAAATISQPATFYSVVRNTDSTGGFYGSTWLGVGNSNATMGTGFNTGNAFVLEHEAINNIQVSNSLNNWHTVQALFNGASSAIVSNAGTPATGTLSTTAPVSTSFSLNIGAYNNGGSAFLGEMMEIGVIAANASSNASALHTNASTFYGY